MKVAIIGGGAGGFFSAIQVKENHPGSEVVIFEKSKKVLSKVKISGGGRCNVTNGVDSITELIKAYPRGGKKLKHVFHTFSNKDAYQWFEKQGIPLTTQDDGCVFPVSQNSQSFIDCFMKLTKERKIDIKLDYGVKSLIPNENGFKIHFTKENNQPEQFDKIIIATGGSPKMSGFDWLKAIGHKIETPLPSLFTFNMPNEKVTELMGVVVENALVKIQGEKLTTNGPLLITHWGMSGPAILKASSFGARILADKNYQFSIQVNWVNEKNSDKVKSTLNALIKEYPSKNITNIRPFYIPERLWIFLIDKLNIDGATKWGQLQVKTINKIIETLTNDNYQVEGKTTFKEEFVTCGGVSLNDIDMKTMQSKICSGLYFTGEVLDIDAITGGYNFQAAWSTAYTAGKLN